MICETDSSPIHNQRRPLVPQVGYFSKSISWLSKQLMAIPPYFSQLVLTDPFSKVGTGEETQALVSHRARNSDGHFVALFNGGGMEMVTKLSFVPEAPLFRVISLLMGRTGCFLPRCWPDLVQAAWPFIHGRKYVSQDQSEEKQGGFRIRCRYTDQMFTLRPLLDSRQAFR